MAKMSRKLYEKLEEELEREDFKLREDYSGRGMFRAECFGMVVSNTLTAVYELSAAMRELLMYDDEVSDDEELGTEIENLLDSDFWLDACSDNLGLDYIVYFPSLTVEKEG